MCLFTSQTTAGPAATAPAGLWQHLPPPAAGLKISVIIPAKDEAANLPATLAALATQLDLQGEPLPFSCYEILVLANNCRDQTAAVVRAFGRQYPALALYVAETTLLAAEAHVGRARCLLMDEACRRLELTAGPAGIIASTDADTRVAPTWLAAMQHEFAAGADAVGGRILPEAAAPHGGTVRRTHLRDAHYRLLRARLEALLDPDPADPWPRHHQHFGASLGITAAAYRRVGGLPVVPFLEDEALCQALRRHDLQVRHSPKVRVVTSARREGRVEVGLSWQLREWDKLARQHRDPVVENGLSLVAEWQGRQQLRQLWNQAQQRAGRPPLCVQLAATLSVPAGALAQQLLASASFGVLWEWVQQHRARWRRHRLVPLPQAILELRQLVARYEKDAAVSGVALAAGQQIEPVLRRPVAMHVP
ncbi:glycosyltransferase [Hymenobacter psychrotolerans]|uniref:Glycosyltransferase like family 2 n=1 Tax=Hymenobacter psychrotolerans DSM 18569 TaxID=1121959 RepID=A0A1M6YQN9_9BACT|nr:glycosyltransferase [Hymenobacter psychrotolerans]SHL20382.1 Glycosyltransferase like family 2 [Hymenobacter psychrotolerans DSM 18569]